LCTGESGVFGHTSPLAVRGTVFFGTRIHQSGKTNFSSSSVQGGRLGGDNTQVRKVLNAADLPDHNPYNRMRLPRPVDIRGRYNECAACARSDLGARLGRLLRDAGADPPGVHDTEAGGASANRESGWSRPLCVIAARRVQVSRLEKRTVVARAR
jgi:hypothetical protein